MKISIIVPCYKAETYLPTCIGSVISQNYSDWELILVDDGSPDNSGEICDKYASADSRIKVIHKTNGGLSDARNVGLDVAQGEYVMFLDSDDWWDDSEALAKIASYILSYNPDIIIFGMKKYFTKDDEFGEQRIPKENTFLLSNMQRMEYYMRHNIFVACAWDKVVKREFIEKDHQRFIKGQYSEDIEWCCKLILKDAKICVIENAFYVYRQQVSTSITANVNINNIISIIDIIDRYAHRNAALPLLHFLANQYVLLITNFMRIHKSEQSVLEKKIKKFWWLLDYDWYPYVRLVSKVKLAGFDVIKSLLRIFYLYKRI